MSIRARSPHAAVGELSGGNQQKVVIGRWLHAGSRLLLLDEPTRGVDVHAKAQIYDLLRELAAAGTAVVFVSSELDELNLVCDRALVLAGGRTAGTTGDGALDRAIEAAAAELLARGTSSVHAVGSASAFTEVLVPPPHLLVFGAGDDAIPLARFASEVAFRVTVVDHRPAFLDPARFPHEVRLVLRRPEEGLGELPVGPDAFAVLKAHSLATDREWLRALLPTATRYLGLLGPRARTEEMLRQIGAARDDRIHGPVGLDLGAEGPEQVALSIVAELLAARAGREPRPLRAREGSIHAA
jgi:xanthine/CO dehydrogenase XdhC/CoxF family maturation factor